MAHVALTHAVYYRTGWLTPWTLIPEMYADSLTMCCAPQVSSAELTYRYGSIKSFSGTTFATRTAGFLLDKYIKIVIQQTASDPVTWCGICVEEVNHPGGTAGIGVATGFQKFKVLGMEYLLERKQVVDSVFQNRVTLVNETLGRGIAFNMGSGDERTQFFQPNRTVIEGDDAVHVFCQDLLVNARPWTARDIVTYLLQYQTPRDSNGNRTVPFKLHPDYEDNLDSLEWWKPQVMAHGRTCKSLIDEIISRQRLMTYSVAVSDVTDDEDPEYGQVYVIPVSLANATITLPSGKLITANPDQLSVAITTAANVKGCAIVTDTQPNYDRVRARGERYGVVGTFGELMQIDWDDDHETEYNDGTVQSTGSDYYTDIQNHRLSRKKMRLERVYRYFKIEDDWDGMGASGYPIMIDPDNTNAVGKFWQTGLRFEPYLPLKNDVDYSNVTTAIREEAQKRREFRRPFAIHYPGSGRPYFIDRPESAQYYGADAETGERKWGVSVRMQEEQFGFILDVHGAPQHAIASAEFTDSGGADATDWGATIDWNDITVTAFVLLDQYVEKQYPSPGPISGDYVKELILDVPGKRAIWLVPGTTVDITEVGIVAVSSAGGWIEDDRDELADIARLMYQWYATERKSVSISVRSLDLLEQAGVYGLPGRMVTTVSSSETIVVNSVITQLAFNFREYTQTLTTQFGQVDFRKL